MITVLCSGGIDSWACLCWACNKFGPNNVRPVYYSFRQKYSEREIAAGKKLCARFELELKVIELPAAMLLKEFGETAHIPLRNLLFLVLSAAPEDCNGVVFGMLLREESEDKNPKFLKQVRKLLKSQFVATPHRPEAKPFQIYTPFAHMTKAELVKWLCMTKFRKEGIFDSTACYNPIRPCGKCISCLNRWVALELNEIYDEDWLFVDRTVPSSAAASFASFATRSHPFWMVLDIALGKRKPLVEKPTLMLRWKHRHNVIEGYRAANNFCKRIWGVSFVSMMRFEKGKGKCSES